MAVNKVIYGGETLVDLTGDTVTAETLAEGVTAHNAAGEAIVGTMAGGGSSTETRTITVYNKITNVDYSYILRYFNAGGEYEVLYINSTTAGVYEISMIGGVFDLFNANVADVADILFAGGCERGIIVENQARDEFGLASDGLVITFRDSDPNEPSPY